MYAVYGGLKPDTARPAESWSAVIDWLLDASPEERHQFAYSWDRDYGILPILWIIRQEDTDLATAIISATKSGAFVYADSYRGNPDNIRDWEQGHFEMLFEIRNRVESGFFTHSNFAYTPDERAYAWDRQMLLTLLPQAALSPIDGQVVDVEDLSWPLPGRFNATVPSGRSN